MPGKKLAVALEGTAEVSKKVDVALRLMSDRQRKIFSCMAMGMDELEIALKLEIEHFKAITKVVYLRQTREDGKPKSRLSENVNFENVHELDIASYERLRSIEASQLKDYFKEDEDFRKYTPDLKNLFKLVAPEAFETITGIMIDEKVSAKTRLSAAESILNRAGYQGAAEQGSTMMPIQVNINFDKEAVPSEKKEIVYAK